MDGIREKCKKQLFFLFLTFCSFCSDYYTKGASQKTVKYSRCAFLVIIYIDQWSMQDLFDFEMDKKVDNGDLWQGNMFNAEPARMNLPFSEQYESREEALQVYMQNEESYPKKMSDDPEINPFENIVDEEVPCKMDQIYSEDYQNPLEQNDREGQKVQKNKKIKKRSKRTIPPKNEPKGQDQVLVQRSQDTVPKVGDSGYRFKTQVTTLSAIKKDKTQSYFHIYGDLYIAVPLKTGNPEKKETLDRPTKSLFIDKMLESLNKECDEIEARLIARYGSLDNIDPLCQKKEYPCSVCGKIFKKSSGLGGHTSKAHPKAEREEKKNGDRL